MTTTAIDRGLPGLPVDRDSDRWKRLRAHCQHAADYLDLDRHTDHVWLAVEAFTNTTAACPQTSGRGERGQAAEGV